MVEVEAVEEVGASEVVTTEVVDVELVTATDVFVDESLVLEAHAAIAMKIVTLAIRLIDEARQSWAK